MEDEQVIKKCRVWNPAIDEREDMKTTMNSPVHSNDFKSPAQFPVFPFPQAAFPIFFQNYLQMAAPLMAARIHKMEEMKRIGMGMNCQQMIQNNSVPHPNLPSSTSLHSVPSIHMSTVTSSHDGPSTVHHTSTVSSPARNPLVQAALGVTNVNENCCAICGASFRLTGDLVQHMRNNHRRTKFKRKHEKV